LRAPVHGDQGFRLEVIILANSIGATLSLAVLGFKIRDLNL